MREIIKKVYTFEELTEEAKQVAIEANEYEFYETGELST